MIAVLAQGFEKKINKDGSIFCPKDDSVGLFLEGNYEGAFLHSRGYTDTTTFYAIYIGSGSHLTMA